jgi:phosphoribosylglycinamide formyltransferase-1
MVAGGGGVNDNSIGIGNGLRTAVLISGSGTNLQAIVDRILTGGLDINLAQVLSDRPDAFGLTRAREAGIPTRVIDYSNSNSRPEADEKLLIALETLAPDLVVLAGFMRILPPDMVNAYPGRMLNIHPSLLPKHRGLHTYRKAIQSGDTWHGTTVHYVTPDLDAGPSIIQYKIPIRDGETEASLRARVQRGEYVIYPRAIGWIADGRLSLHGTDVWLDDAPMDAPVIVEEI